MAENKEEKQSKAKVIYNLGDKQLDLEQYIYNLGINVKGYMDSQNWNEGQRQEFMDSYNKYIEGLKEQLIKGTNRFSSDNFGRITDNDGILGDKDNDGIDENGSEYYYDDKGNQIKTSDYNALKDKDKKKYNTFSANRKVAAYLEKVGRKLSEYSEKKETPQTTKFNLNDHGFMKYWSDAVAPSGDFDFRLILDMDAPDEVTKKRPRTKRLEYLKGQLNDYINHIKTSNYDFSESPFKTSEAYLSLLNTLYRNMDDNIWNTSDIMDASRAGISTKFSNIFFTEEENPDLTDQQRQTSQQQDVIKEKEEAWKKHANEWAEKYKTYSTAQGNTFRSKFNPYIIYVGNDYMKDNVFNNTLWVESFDPSKDENKNNEYSIIINDPERIKSKTNFDDYLNKVLSNPYTKEFNRAMQAMIARNQAIKLEDGRYYIPRASDKSTASALIYNPATSSLYETYIGEVPQVFNQIKEKFFQDNYQDEWFARFNKNGGNIQKLQFGGRPSFQDEIDSSLNQELENRAKKSGRTEKQQKAAERYINEDNKSVLNPDAGFTSAEWARLASGSADIISAVSAWLPGAGTAVSLGTGLLSTVGNLYADVTDDSVSAWDAFKNVGLNLGMDLAGLVPGGGAAGKFTKIARTLKNLAPKVIAVIGTGMHALNTPQYLESWGKLKSEEKLTAQDWNNILSSIQALLGPTAAVGQYAKNKGMYGKDAANKAKRADTGQINEDKIAVKMLDQNGKEKTVLFEGEDVKAIREAQSSGKMEDLKKATIDKFDDLKNYTLNEISFGIRKPSSNGWLPIGQKPRHASNLIEDVTTRQGQDFVRTSWFRSDERNLSTPGMRSSDVQAAVDKRKQDIIDEILVGSKREQKSKEKADKFLENTDKTIQDLETKIGGRKSTTIESDINNINTTRQSAEYKSRLREYTKESKQLDSLIKQKKKLEDALVEHNLSGKALPKNPKTGKPMTKKQAQTEIAALDDAITIRTQSVNNNKGYIESNSDTRLNDLQNQLNDVRGFEADLQAQTTRRQRIQDAYDRRWKTSEDKIFPVSREYNDFVNSHRTPEGKISWDNPHGRENTEMTLDVFNDMLKKAGVIFKEGGTLNLEKVRSYQNASGGGIELNTSNKKKVNNTSANGATWFSDMFSSQAMTDFFRNLDVSAENIDKTIENFNNMQKSWLSNKKAVGYDPNKSTNISYNQGVYDRQGDFNATGLNAAIKIARDNGKFNYPSGHYTGDSEEKGYQDGYFGAQEFLRHYGTSDSWVGNETKLAELQEQLQSMGLTYTLGTGDYEGMYILDKFSNSNNTSTSTNAPAETTPASIEKTLDDKIRKGKQALITNPEFESVLQETNQESKNGNQREKILNNPTIKYGLPRALYADLVNRKLTNMAIEAEKPFLATPVEVHRNVYSDLNAEVRGEKAASQLRNMASQPRTSDASLNTAVQLESELKGQDFINQGLKASDEVRRTTAEQTWQQEKENAQMRNNIANVNQMSLLKTQSNIAKHKMAEASKRYTNWETLSKQLEYNALAEIDKNKAYEEAFIKKDISNYVTNNLAKLAPELEPEAIQIYQQVQLGVLTPSEVQKDANKWDLFMKATKIAQELESDQLRESKNIPKSKWSNSRKLAIQKEYEILIKEYTGQGLSFEQADQKAREQLTAQKRDGGIIEAKDGSKIEVARIKARTKNAELFQKQIKDSIDRNEKVLDRLSKSLYGYVKASIK